MLYSLRRWRYSLVCMETCRSSLENWIGVAILFEYNVNYTARSVIAPDRTLRSDQVRLSYQCLCGLMQQVIINILHKSYNMTYNEAYKYLYEHTIEPDQKIITILEGLIKDQGGIDVIINRNWVWNKTWVPSIRNGRWKTSWIAGKLNSQSAAKLNIFKGE